METKIQPVFITTNFGNYEKLTKPNVHCSASQPCRQKRPDMDFSRKMHLHFAMTNYSNSQTTIIFGNAAVLQTQKERPVKFCKTKQAHLSERKDLVQREKQRGRSAAVSL